MVGTTKQTMDVLNNLIFSEWVSLVQTVAIAVTGFAAVFTLRSSAKLSRHRATVELILAQRTDESLKKATQVMTGLHKESVSQSKITPLACLDANSGDECHQKRQDILTVLNNHEFIALGIREKALDEDVYKRAYYSAVLRDWEATQAFITEIRRQTKRETLFQEFEYLYKRWRKKPLKKDNPH